MCDLNLTQRACINLATAIVAYTIVTARAKDDIRQRVQQGDASFNFNLELAEPGDVINKATVALPEGRKKITLGVLRVTSVSADGGGECLNLNFDPNRMPKGIKGTNDPMLTGRTTPYAVSLGRRLTEGSKQQ